MFENFYTTKMSPEKKSLENRFSKIVRNGNKISKTALIVTTLLFIICAASVSVALATLDSDEKEYQEVNKLVAEKEQIIGQDLEHDEISAKQSDVLMVASPIAGEIKITVPYGERTNPVTGATTFHNGIDIEAKEGDDVFSTIDGVVKKAEFDSKLGNHVVVENGRYSVLVAHLSSIEINVGDNVSAGQLVGKAGKTGEATGVNVHYEFLVDGENIDPESVSMIFSWRDVAKVYETTDVSLTKEYLDEGKIVITEKYYEMNDGSFKTADGYSYKYCLVLSGRMHAAVKDSTFVVLSNDPDITFDMASKASGFSSLSGDYFKKDYAVIVGRG